MKATRIPRGRPSNRPVLRILCLGLVLGVAASSGFTQEESVRPGINESFREPDVERSTRIFESESRPIYAYRKEIVEALNLKPGLDVADIGAGTGFFSLMMAREVEEGGTVYAVDIAKNFIDHIDSLAKEQGISNIKTVLCTETSVELPENSVDVVFVCDTYHHFEYPFKTMASIHKAMRPGGTLVIVDFERIKGVSSEWSVNHVRGGKGSVTDEVKDAGFDFVREVDLMKDQYVIVFKKRDRPAND